MRKDLAAKAITLLLVVGALAFVIWRKNGQGLAQASATSPQDTIYAMLDAARAGNTDAYLALYTGPMHAALAQTLTEKGTAGFKSYLQSGSALVKGVSLQGAKNISADEVQVRVEYVYEDRNEAQQVVLQRLPEGWKIARVDNEERMKTLVPYGTPVQ